MSTPVTYPSDSPRVFLHLLQVLGLVQLPDLLISYVVEVLNIVKEWQ